MAGIAFVTLHLIRFDVVTSLPEGETRPAGGDPVAWLVGADDEEARTAVGSMQALSWAAIGLHSDETSARELFDAGWHGTAGIAGPVESWAGLLQPYSHLGEANWVDPHSPAGLFPTGNRGAHDGPFAAITTAGWNNGTDPDRSRRIEFLRSVAHVRATMQARDGLHSVHVFRFTGLRDDGMTLTFWRDDASERAFAYHPGEHRDYLDHHRKVHVADRTSFTRLRVLDSAGSWHGTDPTHW